MKKLITAAAMLAASTAFTHAASVFFTFNEDSLLDGITKNISANSTIDESLIPKNISSVEEDLSAINDGAKFSCALTHSNSFFKTLQNSLTNKLDSTVIDALSSATGLSSSTISAISKCAGNYYETELTITLTGLQADEQYTVSTICSFNIGQNDTGNGNGSFALTAGNFISGNYGKSTWQEAESGTLALADDSQLPFAAAMVVTPNSEGTISFKLWTGSDINATGNSGTQIAFFGISTIPEPSAFGLLAGLGAIALAVSRRKRCSRR